MARLSMFFGGLALLLAALGLYGVTSYAVNRRRTEIGIRMALGANPSGVVFLVLRVTTLLYGLQPRDPMTFIGAAAVLMAIGLLAGWIPARRAARIDPTVVLRQ